MVRSRPIGVATLAILALVGAVFAGFHTLQYLHLFPFFLGPIAFFGFDFFAAILWGLTTIIYGWVAGMLWNLDPAGWLFVVICSGWNLVLAFFSVLGGSTFQAMLPAILVNAAVLLYCIWPRTREAFARA